MRFVDEVEIVVEAGTGGNGCAAFRREAHVPLGGPSGGDGGDGGDVIVTATTDVKTLIDLRYQRHYRAPKGAHGLGNHRHGRRGEAARIPVPCGTLIFDAETGEQLADLVHEGASYTVAKGGRGGRGNARFVTATNRAPREAQPGQAGHRRRVRLELRLLADVGLVGLPNAGKSTLIACLSAARPKIADYPFTTLTPNLGVVRYGENSFVMADIPGLIAGAAEGSGLGTRFLRHIGRCRVIVYVLDDRHLHPENDLQLLRSELGRSDPQLLAKPSIVLFNKWDIVDDARRESLRSQEAAADGHTSWLYGSAVTGEGTDRLLAAIARHLADSEDPESSKGSDSSPAPDRIASESGPGDVG